MLEIQRLKIIIITDNGTYGFDEKFTRGLNFIASIDNTCGKKFCFRSYILLSRVRRNYRWANRESFNTCI